MNRRLAQGFRPDLGVRAVVALGANLGDRAAVMDAAADALRHLPLTDHVRVAPIVSSVAVKLDGADVDGGWHEDDSAPEYLNTVAVMHTRLAPAVLLDALHRIEDAHGRERRERWGDRTLDLDLIAWGDVTSDDPRLILPHPRAALRTFVLAPWLAVDPEATLPEGRVDALLARLEATSS